jgi:hypothetical protein
VQVISDVLAEHGDNIDAAIKHLTSLRLSAASSSAATPEQQAAAADQQQQQQQAQQGAAAEGPAGPAAAPQKSADEWVDIVVQEMSAAKDMADARARASKVLQAFEQAAVAHSAQAQVGAGGSSGSGNDSAGGGLVHEKPCTWLMLPPLVLLEQKLP